MRGAFTRTFTLKLLLDRSSALDVYGVCHDVQSGLVEKSCLSLEAFAAAFESKDDVDSRGPSWLGYQAPPRLLLPKVTFFKRDLGASIEKIL